ncbi:MAG: lasso RiPP family leader peptide-containing protein [Acidobacteriota bacterium]
MRSTTHRQRIDSAEQAPRDTELSTRRRPYQPPSLQVHGDVRGVTLGATPGVGDSANPTLFRP